MKLKGAQTNAVVVAETAIVGVLPRGLSVSNITRDVSSGTWQFDWELDLTDAISVAEEAAVAAAAEAGETYTPVPTFTADDEKAEQAGPAAGGYTPAL